MLRIGISDHLLIMILLLLQCICMFIGNFSHILLVFSHIVFVFFLYLFDGLFVFCLNFCDGLIVISCSIYQLNIESANLLIETE